MIKDSKGNQQLIDPIENVEDFEPYIPRQFIKFDKDGKFSVFQSKNRFFVGYNNFKRLLGFCTLLSSINCIYNIRL